MNTDKEEGVSIVSQRAITCAFSIANSLGLGFEICLLINFGKTRLKIKGIAV